MRNITAAQWDAVAWAQGSFGVPDTAIAKIINCPSQTVRNARVKGGWDVRDLTKAHSGLTGWRQAEGRSNHLWGKRQAMTDARPEPQQVLLVTNGSATDQLVQPEQEKEGIFPPPHEDDQDVNTSEQAPVDPALTLQRLTTALSRELNAAADGTPDAAALKRVDALVAAAKTFEKLAAMTGSPDEANGDADTLAVEEKTRLMEEMDRRIDELAERRAHEKQAQWVTPPTE